MGTTCCLGQSVLPNPHSCVLNRGAAIRLHLQRADIYFYTVNRLSHIFATTVKLSREDNMSFKRDVDDSNALNYQRVCIFLLSSI